MRTSVYCSCGWRGRRVQGECACYDGYREPFDEANTRGELVRAAVKLETEA